MVCHSGSVSASIAAGQRPAALPRRAGLPSVTDNNVVGQRHDSVDFDVDSGSAELAIRPNRSRRIVRTGSGFLMQGWSAYRRNARLLVVE
jgi:hypothetical protein